MADQDSSMQIKEAIAKLQDALAREAFDQKTVHADVLSAANILLGILGLGSVGSDFGDGPKLH